MPRLKIGVFDSGVGAVPVIQAIQKELPDLEIIYKDDHEHLPYGSRGIEEIHGFVRPIFQEFLDEGCQVIVIACNTVTTNLIKQLREEFPVPMVGMEPAIKQAAAATKTRKVAVFATRRTLSSQRYAQLKAEYAQGVEILEPDCSDWALMVENSQLNRDKIAKTVERICEKGVDQIVLGCTHYHWIEYLIDSAAAGRAEVIQPTKPVVNRLKQVLEQLA